MRGCVSLNFDFNRPAIHRNIYIASERRVCFGYFVILYIISANVCIMKKFITGVSDLFKIHSDLE